MTSPLGSWEAVWVERRFGWERGADLLDTDLDDFARLQSNDLL